jgi:hypothetical protein
MVWFLGEKIHEEKVCACGQKTFNLSAFSEKKLINTSRRHFKDIVQPKKRGVKRGKNRSASTSYTIVDVF